MGALTSARQDARDARHGAGRASWALALLFLSNAFNIGDRTLLGVVTEPIRLELHLSDTEISLTNGFMFVLFNLVAGIFVARLVDRGNRVRILALGIACWSLATAATGLAQGFASLSLARIGVGVGEATGFPAALSLIPDLFRPQVRGRAVAVFQSSTFLGVVGGTILAGVLAAILGWRAMFGICGVAGVALATIMLLSVREPEREAGGSAEAAALPYWSDLGAGCRRVLRMAGFPALAIGFGTSAMIGSVLAAWGPAFLQRSHGVPLAEVGVVIGPAVGLGGITGTLLSGVLADRALARRGLASDMLLVSLWTVPFAAPFVAGFVTAPTVGLTMLSAAAMNFLLSCAVAPCLNYAVTRANPQDRGLTSTRMLGATGLIGGGLGPFLVGVLSDFLQPSLGAESLHYALGLMIASPLLATLFIALAWRQARRATS
jgi:MFS family permease